MAIEVSHTVDDNTTSLYRQLHKTPVQVSLSDLRSSLLAGSASPSDLETARDKIAEFRSVAALLLQEAGELEEKL